jgi:hypothetical protein
MLGPTMKCPHCDVGIREEFRKSSIFIHGQTQWTALYQICPECDGTIIRLERMFLTLHGNPGRVEFLPAFPRHENMRPVPAEVPDPYKQDFSEACAVLSLSPKASAALSRRNLQAILRDKAATTQKDLFDQIDEVIATGKLPSHLEDGLHAVRNIGNFAAHQIKSKTTGAIVDVEPGEAEWNLDVLESLFDFYFVQPALAAKRKADFNKKLTDAGKPPIP